MFKLEIVAEDALPKGVGWGLVETVSGDFYGYIKRSTIVRQGIPQEMVRARLLNTSSAAEAAAS